MNEYKELRKNLRMAGRLVEQEDGSLETYLLTCGKCDEIADLIEQLVRERENDTKIIKGLNKDLAEASRYRDYLGRKYGDCASCCVPACPKRSSSCDGAPCGNWESYEEFCIENKEAN